MKLFAQITIIILLISICAINVFAGTYYTQFSLRVPVSVFAENGKIMYHSDMTFVEAEVTYKDGWKQMYKLNGESLKAGGKGIIRKYFIEDPFDDVEERGGVESIKLIFDSPAELERHKSYSGQIYYSAGDINVFHDGAINSRMKYGTSAVK